MSPAELLLISLGGCVGQHVVQYLKIRGLPSEGLRVRVATEPSGGPLRFGSFTIEIIAPSLDDRQLRALEKAFPAGLVHNALRFEHVLRMSATSSTQPGSPET